MQQFIDTQCLFLSRNKVPKQDNILIESGDIHTKIGSGRLEYRTPYARKWYYIPANFREGSGKGKETKGRGNYWFERMKMESRNKILAGAQKIANGG